MCLVCIFQQTGRAYTPSVGTTVEEPLGSGGSGDKRPSRQRPNHVGATIDVLKNWLAEVRAMHPTVLANGY